MFWRLTNQDFNIRQVDVKNEKWNSLLAGVSFPPSSRPPALAFLSRLKLPFPSFSNACTQASRTAKWTACVQQFFRPKAPKVAILLTKSATIVFFSLLLPSFSLLFLFLLSFSFLIVILELLGPFDYFSWSLKWLQISLGWFSKNRVRFWPYSITNPLLIKLSSLNFGQKNWILAMFLFLRFLASSFRSIITQY